MNNIQTGTTRSSESDTSTRESSRVPLVGNVRSTKICLRHRERLAVVYVRQSSPQQVMENHESRLRQYELVSHAVSLGWAEHQVLVIDEDQGVTGKTADHRSGFKRLISEVTLERVGLVLGLEMSRLARSSKDWHHLLELCSMFGVLLADQDGIYDPTDSNDRLLLGLKGTMSEFELVTMRNRLERGRLHKAERSELFIGLPAGYVKLSSGEIIKEPDEQARDVVQLVFNKFEELGSVHAVLRYLVRNDIQLGLRAQNGSQSGELFWQRPALATLVRMLNHPIYSGAYAYGKRVAERRMVDGQLRSRDRRLPREQWKAFKRDVLPAYITWEQHEENLRQLKRNRSRFDSPGAVRQGDALLAGILFCGKCGRRFHTNYGKKNAYYGCSSHREKVREQECFGLCAPAIDALIARQLFKAMEPAALELSLHAVADEQRERQRLHNHWDQRRERARHETDRAARQFHAVEPENRLVGRTLEQKWEVSLRKLNEVEEEYRRMAESIPAKLSAEEQLRITSLAQDLPALWNDPQTTNADRKAITRCLIERVVAHVVRESEHVDVTIHWQGGFSSQHELSRSIHTYTGTAMDDVIRERVTQLHQDGLTARQIAARLNEEGISPARQRNPFSRELVWQLLSRFGLTKKQEVIQPGPQEWHLAALAEHLGVKEIRLRRWARNGWVHASQTCPNAPWILWADSDELQRLHQLQAAYTPGICRYSKELTTPKPKPPFNPE